MPPSDRKWPKSGRNWAAVATSLVNTRTILLTSDEGMGGIRKGRKKKLDMRLWIFVDGWHDDIRKMP